MTANLSNPEWDHAARIVALFSVLIHAWQTNDFPEAAGASTELERLGVKVRIAKPLNKRQGTSHELPSDSSRQEGCHGN